MSSTKQNTSRDWEFIKQQIDLVDYAEQQGYQINKQKSSNTFVVMRKGEGDVVIIYKNDHTNRHEFFNPNDGNDKGTVIDFQKVRSNGDWKEVFYKIDSYLGNTPANYKPYVKLDPTPPPTREQAIQHEFKFQPLTNLVYLKSRGLTEETISSPEFKNRIFNNTLKDKDGNVFVNVVFPLKNETGTISAIVRNETYNKIDQKRIDASWITNTKHKEGDTQRLVIMESPIDGLSFHQLMPPQNDEKRVYLATAGKLSGTQPRFIQLAIDTLKPKQIILANDNDQAGINQNINIIGFIRIEGVEESKKIKAHLNLPQPSQAVLNVEFVHANQLEGKVLAQSVGNQIVSAINKNTPEGIEKDAKVQLLQNETNRSEIVVSFTNSRPNLIRLERALIDIKGLDELVLVKRSQEKDMNEDLKKAVKHKLEDMPTESLYKSNQTSLRKVSNISDDEVKVIAKNASKEGNKIEFWGKNGYLEAQNVSTLLVENKRSRFKTEFEIIQEIEPKGLLLQKQDKGYKITEKSLSMDLKPDFKGIDSEIDKGITRLKK